MIDDITTNSSTTNNAASESVDSRGIPGWDKVAHLARMLTELEGISVTNKEAHRIKTLWNALDSYDKKTTEVILKSQVQLSQKRTGHTTVQQMRRYVVFSFV